MPYNNFRMPLLGSSNRMHGKSLLSTIPSLFERYVLFQETPANVRTDLLEVSVHELRVDVDSMGVSVFKFI